LAAWCQLGAGFAAFLVAGVASAAPKEGVASDAQPGLYRVGVADPAASALAATMGYGFTEALRDGDGAHHRLSLRLAGALAPTTWLSIAPIVDGRYDMHPDDSGTVIDGALAVRGSFSVGDFRLGAEVKPWVPGSEDVSTTFESLSLDSKLLVGAAFGNGLISASAGYRLDRGEKSGENAATLGFGDRVALGLSEFDAVLVGLGARVLLENTELLAEASGDILVGSGAPPFSESPLRATAGVRQALSERLSAEFLVDVSLSSRPEVLPSGPLVPIEPRVSAFAGIRYRFTGEASGTEASKPPPPSAAVVPITPALAKEAPLEVVIRDEQGGPVADAKVRFTSGPTSRELARDPEGHYRDEQVPAGACTVSVEASGFERTEKSLVIEAGKPTKLELTLTALPPPSQVRGVVRSFGGLGLAAKVRVMPLGTEVATDANGAFQIDVPPGAYDVTIEAEGYETQTRQVRVDPQGVVILNADLVKKGAKK
jgi:hypothetical protein